MQREITEKTDLLDTRGHLTTPGWARLPLWNYSRKRIKAPKFRIKEWDYYCVLSGESGIALTISDMGYLGFIDITLFDFMKREKRGKSVMIPFPMGRLNLPENPGSGITAFKNRRVQITFTVQQNKTILNFFWKDFAPGKNLRGEITLLRKTGSNSITVATPFPDKPFAFYYNEKVHCLEAEGDFLLGNEKTVFSTDNSFGVFDWGRGVWPYKNTWYWGSASGIVNDTSFGFNIGYGFGDLSTHSENALFYDGNLHKLDRITFEIPENRYLLPWHFTDNEGRFEMDFYPVLERSSKTDLFLIKSDQHQIFGKFSGEAVLDDGTVLKIKNLNGFAEKVFNRW